jgi:hypothetical protein
MSDQEILAKISEKQIDGRFTDKKFDPINVVVDTLLSGIPLKQSFNQL